MTMEYRKSKFLFFFELIGTVIVVGTTLIAVGRTEQSMYDTKESQKDMVERLSRIEVSQKESFDEHKMLRMVDSTTLISVRMLLDELKILKRRESRIEWKLKLPPIELENNKDFSTNHKKKGPL
jgi:hypothetical protein